MNNNEKKVTLSGEWLSAAQLAGLPGMPIRGGHVPRLMRRLGVEGRERVGQGGGREYPVSALPPATRAALTMAADTDAARAGRHEATKAALTDTMTEEAARNRRLSGLKESLHQPANAQRRIDAKLAIVHAFEQFHRAANLAVRVSRPEFARRYNAGEIAVEPWVRGLAPAVSDASIWRWQKQIAREGISRLAGAYGNRRGGSVVERQPELHEFIVSMLVTHPHTTVANVMRGVRARFGAAGGVEVPSPRALQKWVTGWKRDNKQVFTAITNPDEWKGRYMAAFGSQSEGVARVNQRWELDSTPGDVMLADGRYAVIGVLDVATRRARLLVAKTSKAAAIATLLRHALIAWGVPETAKTDNGADYTSNHIRRVFATLEVNHVLCPPFQPWHKPHIESFFRTFSHGLVELLPGFIGHNVAERSAIENRRSFADRLMKRGAALELTMTADEFQQFCDRWCEDLYQHEAHQGLAGRTPFEVAAAGRETIRSITDPRALDVLLAEAPEGRTRTVQKAGIQIDGAWFIAPELAGLIGETVLPLLDPLDLGRVYVYDMNDGFVCVAECPERTGMDRREVAIKAKAAQVAETQRQRRALRDAARKIRTDDIAQEILRDRAERAGKLARLPGRTAPHSSAGLAEATKAASRAAHGQGLPAGERISQAERAALDAELAAPPAKRQKVVALDNPEVNFRRWSRLDAALTAGHQVSAEERAWHTAYQGSDEWRAMKRMADDFPELRDHG